MTEPTTDLELRQDTTPARPNLDREITDSWTTVSRPVFWLADQVGATEFVPKGLRGNSPAVAAAILHGRELGLPPMTSLAQTHMIEGKPSLSAEALRALVLAAGHSIEVVRTTGAECTMRGRRRGSQTWTEISWTIDMARAANLTGKNNWKNHPRQMLQARASAELCRLVFPDVCHGMGASEELLDEGGEEDTTAATPAVEGPKTTVGRAKRTTRTQTPVPSGEPGPSASSTPAPKPLEVDVPMPDAPAPSGPVAAQAPGPEVEGQGNQVPADLVEAAAQVPDRETPGDVVTLEQPRLTVSQSRMLHAVLADLGVTEIERHQTIETLLGHELEGSTTKSITKTEAKGLLDALVQCQNSDNGREALDALLAERMREQ